MDWLTADWEMKLSDIANGKLRQDKFLTGIRKYACEIVDEIKGGQGTFRHDNMTNKTVSYTHLTLPTNSRG